MNYSIKEAFFPLFFDIQNQFSFEPLFSVQVYVKKKKNVQNEGISRAAAISLFLLLISQLIIFLMF